METVVIETAGYRAKKLGQEAKKMARALRSARLMLYVWRGVRRRDHLPEHPELDATIQEIEQALDIR